MMNVQSVERTFVDKVFAVCDYKIQNMQNKKGVIVTPPEI